MDAILAGISATAFPNAYIIIRESYNHFDCVDLNIFNEGEIISIKLNISYLYAVIRAVAQIKELANLSIELKCADFIPARLSIAKFDVVITSSKIIQLPRITWIGIDSLETHGEYRQDCLKSPNSFIKLNQKCEIYPPALSNQVKYYDDGWNRKCFTYGYY